MVIFVLNRDEGAFPRHQSMLVFSVFVGSSLDQQVLDLLEVLAYSDVQRGVHGVEHWDVRIGSVSKQDVHDLVPAVEGGAAEQSEPVLVLYVNELNIILHEFLNDAYLILLDGLDQLALLHHAICLLRSRIGHTHRYLFESLHILHPLDLLN